MSIIDPNTGIYVGNAAELENENLFEKIYSTVSESRRVKTEKKRLKKDKCRSLAAERLLMQACTDFGIDYNSAVFTVSESGKPGFADIPVYFSLSHSGDRAMCVMSDKPVGCDVELIHEVNQDISHRFYHPSEIALLDVCKSPEERERLFFLIWTLKESYVKCVGTGFNMPFGSFRVYPVENGWAVDNPIGEEFRLFEYDSGEDMYKYSYCIKDSL